MKRYEVTIPIKPAPWFSGYAEAPDKQTAIRIVSNFARANGFNGKFGRAEAIEVK